MHLRYDEARERRALRWRRRAHDDFVTFLESAQDEIGGDKHRVAGTVRFCLELARMLRRARLDNLAVPCLQLRGEGSERWWNLRARLRSKDRLVGAENVVRVILAVVKWSAID